MGTYDVDARALRAERTAQITAELADGPDWAEDRALRDELITLHLPVAASIAGRYRNRGVPEEDLEQVASVALVLAARRFDPHAGHDFMSFCVPTVRGEVRRHFRDHGWWVRPPRRVQELQQRMNGPEATRPDPDTGRPPTPAQLARALAVPVEDVLEAQGANGCFSPTSLDQPTGESATGPLLDLLGGLDPAGDAAEARAVLGPVVRVLPQADRELIGLRFFDGLTQREIAARLGVSQMQVSRRLARLLAELRRALEPVAA